MDKAELRPLFYQGVSLGQRLEAVCRVAQMATAFHLQARWSCKYSS
jgi:hypothetical protein